MDLVSQNLLMTSGGKKDPTYIDDVFSTYLWKGDGLVGRAIGNGIKLPLNLIGIPMEAIFSLGVFRWFANNLPIVGSCIHPPSSVDDIAMAAIASSTNKTNTSDFILDYEKIKEQATKGKITM